MKKYVLVLLFAMLLTFSSASVTLADQTNEFIPEHDESEEKTIPTYFYEPEAVYVIESELENEIYDYKELANISYFSAEYESDWDKYGTKYFYNQLSNELKMVWDALDVVCISCLNSTEDTTAFLATVSLPPNLSKEDLKQFWCMYVYSNPQYYFIKNTYIATLASNANPDMTSITFMIYDVFKDGEARAEASLAFETQIDKWVEKVEKCDNDVEKARMIYDLICEKVDYNYDYLNGLVQEKDALTQSAYSVFCKDLTVCAGYSDAMTLMCNAVGIDALSVSSSNHQWNKVRINDSWYNVDLTWGDRGSSGINYDYFGRSDAYFSGFSNAESHVELEIWNGYSPSCTIDVIPEESWVGPGTFPVVTKTTNAPVITVDASTGQHIVTITSKTSGAEIYYTLDGTEPSVAFTKSNKYTQPFVVEGNCQIKAIAVYNSYYDSKITSLKYEGFPKIDISGKTVDVTLSLTSYTFAENEKKPKVTVVFDGKTLKKGTDYTVSYKNNVNVGTADVVIKGIGEYTGVRTEHFKIVRRSIAKAKASLSSTSYIYTGSEKKPKITLIWNGKTLKKGTDYTVTYKNNKNIGTATVEIKGVGNYKGTLTKTFKIKTEAGKQFTSNGYNYRITSVSNTTVSFIGLADKITTVKIPKTVKYGGVSFKVTGIGNKALKNETTVTKVEIGSNIKKIDNYAFYGCKKLKTIVIKSTSVEKVGKSVFKGINASAKIKVPSSKLKDYKKIFSGKGQGSKVVIIKE